VRVASPQQQLNPPPGARTINNPPASDTAIPYTLKSSLGAPPIPGSVRSSLASLPAPPLLLPPNPDAYAMPYRDISSNYKVGVPTFPEARTGALGGVRVYGGSRG